MRYIFMTFVWVVLAGSQLSAAELVRTHANIGVQEYLLDNGLKVHVKSNAEDKGDVFIKINFDGGYAQELSIKEMASGFLSFLAFQESILDDDKNHLFSQQCHEDPFEEMRMYVLPMSRGIEARVASHCFDDFASFLSRLFEHPVISPEGYAKAMNKVDSPGDMKRHFDREAAQAFLTKTFSGHTPFFIVVVGDIDAAQVTGVLEKHFAGKKYAAKTKSFPSKMVDAGVLKGLKSQDPANTVSYSLTMNPEPQEMPIFYVMLTVLEKRLREKLDTVEGRKGFRVSPNFPYYPDTSLAFVQIKFNVPPDDHRHTLGAIQREIMDLVQQGPTSQELSKAIASIKKGNVLLSHDNYFWLSVISEYEFCGWDLAQIASRVKIDESITPSVIQEYLKRTLALNRF